MKRLYKISIFAFVLSISMISGASLAMADDDDAPQYGDSKITNDMSPNMESPLQSFC